MTAIQVDTEAIRAEAGKWVTLSDDMARVHNHVRELWLSPTAFFIGNLTELVHSPAYHGFQQRIGSRLRGGAVEFELVGATLRRIADTYDDGEALTTRSLDDLYRVTPADVARATPTQPAGGR